MKTKKGHLPLTSSYPTGKLFTSFSQMLRWWKVALYDVKKSFSSGFSGNVFRHSPTKYDSTTNLHFCGKHSQLCKYSMVNICMNMQKNEKFSSSSLFHTDKEFILVYFIIDTWRVNSEKERTHVKHTKGNSQLHYLHHYFNFHVYFSLCTFVKLEE